MKLVDRERVDGTQITIGRRNFRSSGKELAMRSYTAVFRNADGKQICEALGTSNKAQARRLAIEIQQRLDTGVEKEREPTISVDELVDSYFQTVEAKSVVPRTVMKYRVDFDKLKRFCKEKGITLARRFTADDLYRFRRWLIDDGYAAKTVDSILVLTKQAFKWGWRQGHLRDYRLAAASLPKAKAAPQPCFTTAQVERLIAAADGEDKPAFALMAYAGLRVGEVEQLRWEDVRYKDGKPVMLHIRRGGAAGTTKDKDERFVPVHPRIAELLDEPKKSGTVFAAIQERTLLKRLKEYCKACGFEKAGEFKLHSFRHHFASLCANHGAAHRKALAWLGHSSSEMLDLYYHLHDDDSQQAMQALAAGSGAMPQNGTPESDFEGNLRANGESKIETPTQVSAFEEFIKRLENQPERARFELAIQLLGRMTV